MSKPVEAEHPITGVPAIAAFIGTSPRRTQRLIEAGQLPVFWLGGRWNMRPSRYEAHIARLEAEEAERAAGSQAA